MSTAPSGKPKRPTSSLTRMNLMVNREDLKKLKKLYGVRSESEAARRAHELALLADEALRLAEWSSSRGGPIDVYGRLGGSSLPHEWPQDEAGDEEERPRASATKRRR